MSATIATLSSRPVVLALLGTDILPAQSEPFERITAAISVREALASRHCPRTLLFLVPEGRSSTARYIIAGLLAANYAHAHGFGHLPEEECYGFLKSHVLFITPAVADCTQDLKAMRLAGSTPLTDLWDVEPLSRQPTATRANRKQRLFLANPGWAMERICDRRYSTVVIDATHPRTLASLDELIQLARRQSDLCLVVAPPRVGSALEESSKQLSPDVWLWDPQAKLNALTALNDAARRIAKPPSHPMRICQGDSEADELLGAAYQDAANVTRIADGRPYPGLPLVWSVLNRLRALTVPLSTYEQAAAKSWAGGLGVRMKILGEIAGHSSAIWDATWPKVRSSLEAAYAAFLRREETAKFWALAERLEQLLRRSDGSARLVMRSAIEAGILVSLLQDVVDELPDAIASGRFEIVTHTDEARRVAEGFLAQTLLLGPRPTKFRYLSLYPSFPHEELLYPFEVPLARSALNRQYAAAEALQSDSRPKLLERLQLEMLAEVAADRSAPPSPDVSRADGRPVTLSKLAAVDPQLNLDLLASVEGDVVPYAAGEREGVERSGSQLEVTYSGGLVLRYAIEEMVDVYYAETEKITRKAVTELSAGMRVIRFVDGRYDSLFRRMTEAIKRRLSSKERMSLELWEIGKRQLSRLHPDKQALYDALRSSGLQSLYTTFAVWFREDTDTIAPQQEAEFVTVAKLSGVFRSEKQISATFRCIQRLRGRNRTAGRQLRALLRCVVSREGFDEALENVRQVDPDLADVCAAVDVTTVQEVRHL